MDNKNELQDFNLDDILSEFQNAGSDDISADLDSLLGDWNEVPAAASDDLMDTARMNEMIAQLTEAEAAPSPEEQDVPMDTLRMTELIKEIVEENAAADAAASADTRRMESLSLESEGETSSDDTIRAEGSFAQAAEEGASADETIRVDELLSQLSDEEAENDYLSDPTIRMELSEEDMVDMESLDAAFAQAETSQEEAPRILYNPRTRLRELKRKLVAGPEKRYYELSESGVGRLQVGIGLSLILVALCAITTTLYSLDMISGNRLRFVIFSQILAMLLSALLGCHQMLDGLGDLFKGRFTINTLLTFTFAACCADAVFCLSELRIPCCAAFSLEVTMALWARYHRFSTEMAQMDSLRKAVRLNAIVKSPDYYDGKPGILRRDGEVEDFMDTYTKPSGPERLQSIYCFLALVLCIGIAVYSGMNHGISMAMQILSTSLLVAVPASFFVSLTRPASLLQRRLHMVGTVLCGWKGAKGLRGKAVFPLRDEDLFPAGTTKLNGVKYYGDRNPDEVLSYTTSLISAAGGGLVPVFQQMLADRAGGEYPVANFQNYGSGGVGGEICDEPVLLGTMDFLQDMGVEIPEGTMVSQAVYAAIDGQLCAVFAISYAKMRSAAAGIVSLCGTRKITPVLIGTDFMLTGSLLRAKFSVNTRRIAFPDRETRQLLAATQPDADAPALALVTRDDLASYAYAVSGARALCASLRLGVTIHLIGGIIGILIMAALAILGNTELLTPTHILLYQLVWMVPGLLITEWARTA